MLFKYPVSSLDHINRDRVAERLAIESLKRQVVIFTHDIAFLVLLEEACRETRDRAAIPIAYRVISRGALLQILGEGEKRDRTQSIQPANPNAWAIIRFWETMSPLGAP